MEYKLKKGNVEFAVLEKGAELVSLKKMEQNLFGKEMLIFGENHLQYYFHLQGH